MFAIKKKFGVFITPLFTLFVYAFLLLNPNLYEFSGE